MQWWGPQTAKMAVIVIEPPYGDTGEERRRALQLLKEQGMEAQRHYRAMQPRTLLRAADIDAERVVEILAAAGIRAWIRPA